MRALLMRLTLASTLLLAVACNRDLTARPPVETRLYYPSGVAFAPAADGGLGRLYVANSNFDRRFDIGWSPRSISPRSGPAGTPARARCRSPAIRSRRLRTGAPTRAARSSSSTWPPTRGAS